MDSNGSKPNNESIATPKKEVDICGYSDPRSPTPEITRTPIQDKPGAKYNITKNRDLRKIFDTAKSEEKLIHNNPILSAAIKNHLQSYDPRSPTQDFDRTPIVISSGIDKIKHGKKLIPQQSENFASSELNNTDEDFNYYSYTEANESPELVLPQNLCNDYDMTLDGTIKDSEEPWGSSTASNEAIQENISTASEDYKPPKLLKTDFDYIECDEILKDKCENVKKSENGNAPVFKVLDIDPRSPCIGTERTPIVITKVNENYDNVEEMSDDSLIKILQSTNAELRQTGSITHDKNTDKLLVYEDETTNNIVTPKKSKSTSNSESRTPLSCMKNKDGVHARSKSTYMLYDSKNKKLAVTQIPRLKSKAKEYH